MSYYLGYKNILYRNFGKKYHRRAALMKYVHVLAEGQTEVSFIKQVLCGYFLEHGLVLDSRAVETSRDSRRVYRGGVTSYAKAQADLKRWIKERPGDYFTSMFDFYRLPPDFPGMSHNAASDLQK
mgnify:FL=1